MSFCLDGISTERKVCHLSSNVRQLPKLWVQTNITSLELCVNKCLGGSSHFWITSAHKLLHFLKSKKQLGGSRSWFGDQLFFFPLPIPQKLGTNRKIIQAQAKTIAWRVAFFQREMEIQHRRWSSCGTGQVHFQLSELSQCYCPTPQKLPCIIQVGKGGQSHPLQAMGVIPPFPADKHFHIQQWYQVLFWSQVSLHFQYPCPQTAWSGV